MSKKINLYPKQCESYECKKGINEGWTDECYVICDSCFDENKEWKEQAKKEWDIFEKDNSYNPSIYKTSWNFELFDEEGFDKNGKPRILNPYNKHKYNLMDGDVMEEGVE